MDARRATQIAEFRAAVADRLSRLGVTWIQVESGVAPQATTVEMLRELHTLKGEAGILGFATATDVIHALEAAIQRGAEASGDAVLRALDLLAEVIQDDPGAARPASIAALLDELGARPHASREVEPRPAEAPPDPRAITPVSAARRFGLRIAASQLDRMRDAIGDLLSLRIRMSQLAGQLGAARRATGPANLDAHLKRSEAQLRDDALVLQTLVGSLEATVRELRVMPIGFVLERYPRIARDLGRALGKTLRVDLEGEDAGVDRDVIEVLDMALLHLVRNAVDHGIEPAEVRRARGKPDAGTIRIAARVTGSRIQVTVADDGGGIDVAAVRRVAIERKLVDPKTDAADDRVIHWIMLPGFTTRDTATQVSGRGVGLDAVHSNVQALGGSLSVASERERGTTFQLSVPINTAITSVLLFHVGGARYALPAGCVEDVVDGSVEHQLEDSLSGAVVAYHGIDLPVVALAELLGRTATRTERPRLVIVRTGLGLVACTGSHGHEHREVVMRPAGTLLSPQAIATAAVVLEDGEVALVLNPARFRGGAQPADPAATPRAATVLVVDDSPIVRDLIAEVLRSHGLLVIEAVDGLDALEQLQLRPDITLLVTDVEMPRLDGFELIRRVRAGPGRRIPAVVVSTRGSDEDKRLAVSIGADAYLVKTDLTHDSLWTLIGRFVSMA